MGTREMSVPNYLGSYFHDNCSTAGVVGSWDAFQPQGTAPPPAPLEGHLHDNWGPDKYKNVRPGLLGWLQSCLLYPDLAS